MKGHGGRRPGAGRPPLGVETVTVAVRMAVDDRDRYRAAAIERGLTLSGMVRAGLNAMATARVLEVGHAVVDHHGDLATVVEVTGGDAVTVRSGGGEIRTRTLAEVGGLDGRSAE